VHLVLEDRGHGVVVVVGRRVVDVGLGGGVAEGLAAGGRGLDALLLPDDLPPAFVELAGGHALGVELALPFRHGAAAPEHHGDAHGQGVVEEHLHGVGLV